MRNMILVALVLMVFLTAQAQETSVPFRIDAGWNIVKVPKSSPATDWMTNSQHLFKVFSCFNFLVEPNPITPTQFGVRLPAFNTPVTLPFEFFGRSATAFTTSIDAVASSTRLIIPDEVPEGKAVRARILLMDLGTKSISEIHSSTTPFGNVSVDSKAKQMTFEVGISRQSKTSLPFSAASTSPTTSSTSTPPTTSTTSTPPTTSTTSGGVTTTVVNTTIHVRRFDARQTTFQIGDSPLGDLSDQAYDPIFNDDGSVVWIRRYEIEKGKFEEDVRTWSPISFTRKNLNRSEILVPPRQKAGDEQRLRRRPFITPQGEAWVLSRESGAEQVGRLAAGFLSIANGPFRDMAFGPDGKTAGFIRQGVNDIRVATLGVGTTVTETSVIATAAGKLPRTLMSSQGPMPIGTLSKTIFLPNGREMIFLNEFGSRSVLFSVDRSLRTTPTEFRDLTGIIRGKIGNWRY